MTAITFMKDPNYVEDRNNILLNSELALQSLEKSHLLSASQQANNAASSGQGNTLDDFQYTTDYDYSEAVQDTQTQTQKDLDNLYNDYANKYLGIKASLDKAKSAKRAKTANFMLNLLSN